MPEGDTLHRAARRLQELVGEVVEVETPNPRAAVERIAERLDGRRLEAVQALGKNLLLSFDGGYVLRSHLRMTGRWRVLDTAAPVHGTPWLILRGATRKAVLWNGPVLQLHGRAMRRLGPDILSPGVEGAIAARVRREPADRPIGEVLLDQRVVAGIGNLWKAESLWHAQLSPWRSLGDLDDDELRSVLHWAARLMRESLESGRERRAIYRRAGRPCPRCGAPIVSRGQGDENRTAYWCPSCQPLTGDRQGNGPRVA